LKQICDVCSANMAENTTSSGITPVSLAVCCSCQYRGAETLGLVHFWIVALGGVERAPGFAKKITSWYDGKYIDWGRCVDLYFQNETEIRKLFLAEFSVEPANFG
jgi:hypothetical protein